MLLLVFKALPCTQDCRGSVQEPAEHGGGVITFYTGNFGEWDGCDE